MPVAAPPQPLRPLSPEESRLLDLYVDAECDFLAFRNASGLSSFEALDFLRSIPEHLEALDAQLTSAWNRFTISRKTNVIRVLEQVIAENRDNPVERRRAATAILRAIHPPRPRLDAPPRDTPSPVQPDRVPPTPPRSRPRDEITQALIAGEDLACVLAKVEALHSPEAQGHNRPAAPRSASPARDLPRRPSHTPSASSNRPTLASISPRSSSPGLASPSPSQPIRPAHMLANAGAAPTSRGPAP